MVWKLTGRLARSKALIWRLASNDPTVIHATAIAMHAVVDSLERMRKAMRTDVWDTPAHGGRSRPGRVAQLIRECPMGMDGHDGLRPNTLVVCFSSSGRFTPTAVATTSPSRRGNGASAPPTPSSPGSSPTSGPRPCASARRRRAPPAAPLAPVHRLVVAPFIAVVEAINRRVPWYRLPWLRLSFLSFLNLSFGNLILLRTVLRHGNLFDTSLLPSNAPGALPGPRSMCGRLAHGGRLVQRPERSDDGSRRTLVSPVTCRWRTPYSDQALYDPEDSARCQPEAARPREVRRARPPQRSRLRVGPVPGARLVPPRPPDRENTSSLDPDDPKGMRVGRTVPDPTRTDNPPVGAPTYLNTVTHWWDGSQLCGSDQDTQNLSPRAR